MSFKSITGQFQHTAARRRLNGFRNFFVNASRVSTHSRPKAAESAARHTGEETLSFNTQPPEGG